MVIGFTLNRTHLLDSKGNKAISNLLVYAASPAMTIGSIASTGNLTRSTVVLIILLGIGIYIVLPLFAFLAVRLLNVKAEHRGIAQLLLIFGNTGFMAIPILQSLYGDVSIFVVNIMNLPFNFIIYTYGIYLINQDNRARLKRKAAEGTLTAEESEHFDKISKEKDLNWRLFVTPPIIASVLSVIMFFCEINLPEKVNEGVMYLGNCTPPLSMLLLGSLLAENPLKGMFSDLKVNCAMIFKMLVMPFIVLLIAKPLFHDPVLVGISALTYAMPSGTLCAILCKNKDGDTAVSSGGVVFSTLVSLITIPIVYLILAPMFG